MLSQTNPPSCYTTSKFLDKKGQECRTSGLGKEGLLDYHRVRMNCIKKVIHCSLGLSQEFMGFSLVAKGPDVIIDKIGSLEDGDSHFLGAGIKRQ